MSLEIGDLIMRDDGSVGWITEIFYSSVLRRATHRVQWLYGSNEETSPLRFDYYINLKDILEMRERYLNFRDMVNRSWKTNPPDTQ